VTREEIFYTTKLKTNVSRIDTVDKIKKSLKTSTLSYIDLYLLHSPIGGPKVREECWAGCMDAKEYGWVKSIGVSNYGVKHIQEFEQARDRAQKAGKKYEMPVLNQVDLHPFMRRQAIVDICEKNDILLEVRFDHLLFEHGNSCLPLHRHGARSSVDRGSTTQWSPPCPGNTRNPLLRFSSDGVSNMYVLSTPWIPDGADLSGVM
jgi:hypothetical protein